MANDTDLHALSCKAMMDVPRIRPALEKIADKWTIMILTVLCPQPARFNEIKRRLDGITHKSLADALKRLERHGLITRTVIPTTPIGVVYTITSLGHSLREPFEALCTWALNQEQPMAEAVIAYDKSRALSAL